MKSNPKSPGPRIQTAAFTLTELLVTITIIIVLVALTMTGLSRMRAAADKAVATRNISQLQTANISYASENNGQYVPVYAFDDTGSKYVAWMHRPEYLSFLKGDSTLYLANGKVDSKLPLNLMDPVTVRSKAKLHDSIPASFGYMTNGLPGMGWGKPNSTPSYRISQLASPERTAAFVTATDWNVSYSARLKWETSKEEGFVPGQRMSYRHGGKALVVHYDGHVGEVSVAEVRKIDTQGGSNHIFWNGSAR